MNTIEIRWIGGKRPWRLYRTGTKKLADRRRFATIKDAGDAARAILWPSLTLAGLALVR